MPKSSNPKGEPQPEPSANRSPNQSERFAEQWRTVPEVAELEGLSERAIQKRCQRGHYTARRVEGEKGEVWEIAAASIGAPKSRRANAELTANGSPNKSKPNPNSSPNKGEPNAERFAEPSPNGAAEPGYATKGEIEALRVQLEDSRAEVEREREISAFLKLQIEEGNRNAGELRAALREALRAMPKQLEAGAGKAERRDAAPQSDPGRPQFSAASEAPSSYKSARREPRPLWKVVLGVR